MSMKVKMVITGTESMSGRQWRAHGKPDWWFAEVREDGGGYDFWDVEDFEGRESFNGELELAAGRKYVLAVGRRGRRGAIRYEITVHENGTVEVDGTYWGKHAYDADMDYEVEAVSEPTQDPDAERRAETRAEAARYLAEAREQEPTPRRPMARVTETIGGLVLGLALAAAARLAGMP